MKKSHIILTSLIALSALVIPANRADALTVDTCAVSITGNTISISGTVEDGMLATSIFIYDETGTDRLALDNVSVASDNTYSGTFEMPEGSYVVRVADYDNGAYCTNTATIASATTPTDNTNTNSTSSSANRPDTGQMTNTEGASAIPAISIIAISAIITIAIAATVFIVRRFRHRQ